jgi:hypothetical protein
MTTLAKYTRLCGEEIAQGDDKGLAEAVQTMIALSVDKQADLGNAMCAWEPMAQCPRHLFGRQAIGMIWDFAEGVPIGDSSGAFGVFLSNMQGALKTVGGDWSVGSIAQADATKHPLPDDSAAVFFTDPPYFDAVPYADLSDFFYVWLRRTLPPQVVSELFHGESAPKEQECVVDEVKGHDRSFFERTMASAMTEGRRILSPSGVGTVVFAHKTTSGWESQLQAIVDAGWTVTGSWPVDTECGSRLRAMDSAALASSVHIVVRPRENEDGTVRHQEVGDWREVLRELPKRIHQWMPRLASEGVVGADAIFACLGPALEIFSRYSRVEKASGEQVKLREYLEQVWAAVSQEALRLVFEGGDASGFEEDARLTAMWLWTLSTGNGSATGPEQTDSDEESGEDDGEGGKKGSGGYVLEFDAARKIAQGLGAHLEVLDSVVEVKGDTARLLAVSERTRHLFGKDEADAPERRKKKTKQMNLAFEAELEQAQEEGGWGAKNAPKLGKTTLDRVHQAMILFAAGRGEAMKRFLVEEGVGRESRFWTLAQALAALYPSGTDERRWVEGVLARKKGLGF